VNNIDLRVDGLDYSGWTKATIARSIDAVCASFSLTLTEQRDVDVNSAHQQVRAGQACELRLNNTLVLSGVVDDAMPSYDARQHTITVRGRSKARNLVDCGRPAQQWRNQNLLQLAKVLAAPFDIDVRSDTDVGAAFERPAIEPGQTSFEFLEKMARQRGVRFISDPDGTLVITGVGTKLAPDVLQLGGNIRSASGNFSMRARFHSVTVLGQRIGTDWAHSAASAQNKGVAIDASIDVLRTHYIVSESAADSSDCKTRAQWRLNTAFGRSQALTYTVYGWEHSGGLWEPNTLVQVHDKWMGFDGEQLLIASLRFLLDDEGLRTELQLMKPEAFELLPLPDKAKIDAKGPAKWN